MDSTQCTLKKMESTASCLLSILNLNSQILLQDSVFGFHSCHLSKGGHGLYPATCYYNQQPGLPDGKFSD